MLENLESIKVQVKLWNKFNFPQNSFTTLRKQTETCFKQGNTPSPGILTPWGKCWKQPHRAKQRPAFSTLTSKTATSLKIQRQQSPYRTNGPHRQTYTSLSPVTSFVTLFSLRHRPQLESNIKKGQILAPENKLSFSTA